MRLTGTGVALVTPFSLDGNIDFLSLEKLINHSIAGGVEYIVVLGTTAEIATLSSLEKKDLINFVVEVNNKRVPLVLGLGGNNTHAVVEEIKSTDLSQFDAILSASPHYNKPTQEGIYQHFAAIANVCPIDIILYNVPGRTGSNMFPETIVRLADDFTNIVAVKEAAGMMKQAMELIQNKPAGFHIISGDDSLALPITLLGGSGVISVIGQAFPEDFSEMIRLALDGKVREATELHYNYLDLIGLIFEEGNPSGIKTVLKKLDICSDSVRLPLISSSNILSGKIDLIIDRLYVV
ncbi:MAG: 4-hydroxy-tetrahydrodipicolinate synthase [Flavobacteriales bacterium]|nr:4-hydroxy-tetrahydrodipicolinate synthase [Flavobacteriales bacterium]